MTLWALVAMVASATDFAGVPLTRICLSLISRSSGLSSGVAADRAGVPRARVGVDIDHGDIAYRNTELFGDDHGDAEAGDRAHVDLADVDRRRTVFVDLDDSAAAGTGALDPRAGGDADALVLLQLDFAPADFFFRDADRLAERDVAQLRHTDDLVARLGHILHAKFRRIHPKPSGDRIHVRFDGERSLRAAGTAHRTADLLVRVNDVTVDVAVRHQVPAAAPVGI